MRCCIKNKSEGRAQKSENKIFFLKNDFLFSAFCLLTSALPLNACPLCSEAIAKAHGLAQGITWGIFLMLAVPFLVVGVISTVIVRAHKRANTPTN
jgi:hypothetical protein